MPSNPRTDAHWVKAFIGVVKQKGGSLYPGKVIKAFVKAFPHVTLHQCAKRVNINLCCNAVGNDYIRLCHYVCMNLAWLLGSKNKGDARLAAFPEYCDEGV